LGIDETFADKLLIYDVLDMKFRKVGHPKDPARMKFKKLRATMSLNCSGSK